MNYNQLTPFAILFSEAEKPEHEDYILLIPTKIWRASLDCLYKPLQCDIVERVQIMWGGPSGFRYMWIDEEGPHRAKPVNSAASSFYATGRDGRTQFLVGRAAVEGKPFDERKIGTSLMMQLQEQFAPLNSDRLSEGLMPIKEYTP